MKDNRVKFSEGDVFLVPLIQGGFAVGLIARRTAKGDGVLAYIFKEIVSNLGPLEMGRIVSKDMVADVVDVGVQSLNSGDWPVVGRLSEWRRSDWPVPLFRYQAGQISKRSQEDYQKEIEIIREVGFEDVFRFVVYGHSSLGKRLSNKFAQDEKDRNWKVR